MHRTYDWNEIRKKVEEVAKAQLGISYKGLAAQLGIPVSTLHDNVSLEKFRIESSGTTNPQTPQELAAKAGIDLSKFRIKTYNCTVREDDYADLHWTSRMTLDPISDVPTLAPVVINVDPRRKAVKVPISTEKVALILPDIHFGFGEHGTFHDWDILHQVIEYVETTILDEIIILGDILDLPEFTDKFAQRPEYIKTTQDALNECASFLALLRFAAGDGVPITIIEGNHDFRLTAMLRKYMMALAGLHRVGAGYDSVSVPWFLNLDQLKIKYISGWPDNIYMVNDVKVIHGDVIGSEPGQTVGKMLGRYNCSTIFGHIHRREYAEGTAWSDKTQSYKRIFSYSPGCLCKIDGSVPGSSTPNNWRQGMGLLISTSDGDSFIQDMPYNGKRFLL